MTFADISALLHRQERKPIILAVCLIGIAAPALARDSLGTFAQWGAFRDPQVPRCYAIARPYNAQGREGGQAFASVGHWPRGVRNQFHARLARPLAPGSGAILIIAGKRLRLRAGGVDAWAPDSRADAAITAAMRSARTMTVSYRSSSGTRADRYTLPGAATAIDAAAVGCTRYRRH